MSRRPSELKGKGVDEIACISVNDPFVMAAWDERDGIEDITMLADGNGDFADAVGLAMDGSKFGMGKRSQRYSMIVNDGVVEQLNVEAPGEYRASSAETYARPAGDRLTLDWPLARLSSPLIAPQRANGERFQSFNRIESETIPEEEIDAEEQQSRRPQQQSPGPQPV